MSRAFGGRSLTTSPPTRTVPRGDLLEPGDHPQRRSSCRSPTGRRRRRTRRRRSRGRARARPASRRRRPSSAARARSPPRRISRIGCCKHLRYSPRRRWRAVAAAGGAEAAAPVRRGAARLPRDAPRSRRPCSSSRALVGGAARARDLPQLHRRDRRLARAASGSGSRNFRARAARPDLPRRALAHVPLHGDLAGDRRSSAPGLLAHALVHAASAAAGSCASSSCCRGRRRSR